MRYKIPKKNGWFIGRTYRHFDRTLSFERAVKLVTKESVEKHNFFPLLSYQVIERRFRGLDKHGQGIVKHKSRLICKSAHRDSQIYAYYAYNLELLYAKLREAIGIDDCVLAYRSGKGSNIHMANEAFEAIKSYDSSSVIAMDISGFFDNIDHKGLKARWCRVLDKKRLPNDHFNIFQSLTRFSRIDQTECLEALGLIENDLKNSTERLCNEEEFHRLICKRGSKEKSLIIKNSYKKNIGESRNWKNYGIPQGTPISAVLSNIFMIDFDLFMQGKANSIGAVYRRYSDDILFICPQENEDEAVEFISKKVKQQGEELDINESKTEIVRFNKINKKVFECKVQRKDGSWESGGVQYLGFNFNGRIKTLRNSTLSRFQRKRKYAVRAARRTAEHFKKDKIRSKKLYLDLTDIGSRSMPSYAKRAAKILGDDSSVRQLKNHKRDLKQLIKKQDAVLKKRTKT